MAVVLVQKSAALTTAAAGAASITPTLPGGSTAGNTIAAMVVSDAGDTCSTPANWSAATGSNSLVFIRWLPDCGAGVTSQAFTNNVGGSFTGNTAAAMFEFSGLFDTAVDLNEILTPASGTSWTATSVASMKGSYELILLGWRETFASATKDTFTATTSGVVQDFAWNQATKLIGHASFEHKLDSGTSTGSTLTVTETMVDGTGNSRAVTIITFKQALPVPNGPVHLPFVN